MRSGLLFVVAWLLASPVYAHDWYPSECCSDRDCRPVPCGDLTYDRTRHETIYKPTGAASLKLPRASEDGQCHVCLIPGASAPICIFLPGTS